MKRERASVPQWEFSETDTGTWERLNLDLRPGRADLRLTVWQDGGPKAACRLGVPGPFRRVHSQCSTSRSFLIRRRASRVSAQECATRRFLGSMPDRVPINRRDPALPCFVVMHDP